MALWHDSCTRYALASWLSSLTMVTTAMAGPRILLPQDRKVLLTRYLWMDMCWLSNKVQLGRFDDPVEN